MEPAGRARASGRRPSVVLSRGDYNAKTGLAVFCPVTRQGKGYTFEVPLPAGQAVSGVVLADQVKCLDWRHRNAVFADRVSDATLNEIRDRLAELIEEAP
jgi:mRNA interferase MazF